MTVRNIDFLPLMGLFKDLSTFLEKITNWFNKVNM